MNCRYSQHIDAPIEKTFDWVDDPEKLKLWIKGLEETTYLEPLDRSRPVGARFKQTIREGGRLKEYDGEVTAYDRPRHLGVRISNASFAVQVDYRFQPEGSGTRLDFECGLVRAPWIVRFLGFVFNPFASWVLSKQMIKLKELAEKG